jgi:dihydrofolate reductase
VKRPLIIVAAVAENGVIGRGNQLIWRLKSDLRRFRTLTMGKPMIMGRKTFDSIGRPLPGRDTIVLTRHPGFAAAGVTVAHGWDEAVSLAEASAEACGADEVMVVGGAEIYALALPESDRLRLTLVATRPEGDALFPPWDRAAFREIRREAHPAGPDDEHAFIFLDLERRPVITSR